MKQRMTSVALLIISAFGISAAAGAEKPAAPKGSERFEKEIAAFEAADRTSPPPQGAVLFVGDSGIRRWTTLAQDFPDQKVINRGFGGSALIDAVYYVDRIVVPYKPRIILLREGGNDLTGGRTPEQILGDLQAFVEKVRAKLPQARIIIFGTNPNTARWKQAEQRKQLNAMYKQFVAKGENLDYIDVWDQFLGPDGMPRADLFVKDGMHQNAEGYKVLTDAVKPHLK